MFIPDSYKDQNMCDKSIDNYSHNKNCSLICVRFSWETI